MESARSILFAFLAGLLWFSVLVQVDAKSQVQEVEILTGFMFDSSDYAPYWSTWNESDENACAWVGVTRTANSTVEALDFSGWGLVGVGRFSELSKLPDLRQIDMSSNTINGPIPDDIGNLTQLSRLDLSFSGYSGSIPSSISACRSLKYLSLKGCMFTGTIPDLSGMLELEFLLLADNQLNGSFPIELAQMSNLVTIDISSNQLRTIPSPLKSTNLRALLLDNNSFVGFEEPIPYLINAPNLQQLSVLGNLLHGMIPPALVNLSHLVTLNMSSNQLGGSIPLGLLNINDGPFTLDLSQNQLSGSIPADLLQIYPIEHDKLGGNSPVSIKLSHNLLNGSIPASASSFGPEFLDLIHKQLTGPVPSTLLFCFSLNLENNLLSGDIGDFVAGVVDVIAATEGFDISEVHLGNNYLMGDLSRMTVQWSNWRFLQYIDLSNNNLSWTASESIPDPIGTALSNMPTSLTQFLVEGNNFLGTPLPRSSGKVLENLTTLDLSNSHLDGTISGDVFNSTQMPNLRILNLSHNSVTGHVPENIVLVPSLTILDLSDNRLWGALPSMPLNMFLINPSFYKGNEGLCGYPLPSCPGHRKLVEWWALLIIVAGTVMIVIGSCLMATWRWRVYQKLHEQDADLIRTLMERELVTLMPMRDLTRATNNFAESAKIGEGGFGTVYKGNLNDGTKVAIKRSKREGSEKDKEQFLNEMRILSQVNYRYLVKLMGCCMENKVALLVFEFISNGTLQDHLRGEIGDGHLSWKQRLNIAVQTADALNYLHSATAFPIYHRDVKSANILLNDDLSAKVADFGISKLAPPKATHVSTALQGTIGYMDPEYWISFQLTEKSDVFSFGVVLLELISAKPAIDYERGGTETSLVIFASPYIRSENLEPLIDPTLMGTYSEQNGHGKKSISDVARLAMRCVQMQSNARPRMSKVLKVLQDVCLRFEGTSMPDEDMGCLNIGDPLLYHDHERFSSSLASTKKSDPLQEYNGASLQLSQFSSPSPGLER